MSAVVYIATSTATTKAYVGKSHEPEKRWRQHINDAARGEGHALHAAMRKYGAETFSFSVLEHCDSDNDALVAEQYWIHWYGTVAPGGYNLTSGGDGGYVRSAETLGKMAAAMRGRKASAETRAKQSAARLGRKLTAEQIKKSADGRRGQRVSAEQREKLRLANLGKKASDETKAKMRAAKLGRKMSPEAIEKSAAKRRGRVFGEEFREKIRQSWVRRKARAGASS